MKALTISRVRELIKRELGFSASSLERPSDMNVNPKFPWYELHLGNQRIEVCTEDVQQGKITDKMVRLSVTHENSSKEVTEYFYNDTLKYAAPFTEWKNREIFCETMDDPKSDATLCRLKREALDDCWNHFHAKQPQSVELPFADLMNEYNVLFKKVIANLKRGKPKPDIVRLAIADCNKFIEHLNSIATVYPECSSIKLALEAQKDQLEWLKKQEQKQALGQTGQDNDHIITVYQSPDGRFCSLRRIGNHGEYNEHTGIPGKQYVLPNIFHLEYGYGHPRYIKDYEGHDLALMNDKNGKPALFADSPDTGRLSTHCIPLKEYTGTKVIKSIPEQLLLQTYLKSWMLHIKKLK